MSKLNAQAYDNALNTLGGGSRRRRNKRRSNRRFQARSRNQKQNQNGGFFPGLGGIVQQALVPFGLYAMQHSIKKSSLGNRSFMNKPITPSSFRRSFTRKR